MPRKPTSQEKPAKRVDPADKPGNPEFDHFEDLTRKLLKVSKQELDEKRNGGAPA
jgi:hypothetical protein